MKKYPWYRTWKVADKVLRLKSISFADRTRRDGTIERVRRVVWWMKVRQWAWGVYGKVRFKSPRWLGHALFLPWYQYGQTWQMREVVELDALMDIARISMEFCVPPKYRDNVEYAHTLPIIAWNEDGAPDIDGWVTWKYTPGGRRKERTLLGTEH